jgi:hypothetical protein
MHLAQAPIEAVLVEHDDTLVVQPLHDELAHCGLARRCVWCAHLKQQQQQPAARQQVDQARQ